MKSLIKRGRWHIIEENHKYGGTWPNLVHYCHPDSYDPRPVYRVEYTSHKTNPAWRCGGCWKKPPESILTIYILFNWDEACEEINDV